MKFSHKLSDAVHLLVYIEIFPDDDLSSRAIARSIVTNPSMVRSLMMDLRKAACYRLKEDCGLDYEPTQIVVASGLEELFLQLTDETATA